jgi:predicted N-formylglutamate amidohydrolase
VNPQGSMPATRLLAQDEPHPLETRNLDGASDFVIICEHAGRLIPRALGDMGVSAEDLGRHIAWDLGAKAVATRLSDRLGAPLLMQRYSRLVCDCNRRPDVPSFAPEISEATTIPANVGLTPADRTRRAEEIFWPFQDAVTACLDGRQAEGRRTLLVTIHSFTPVFLGVSRPWEIGILYHRDGWLSPALAEWFKRETGFCVGVNQPYSVGDETDYAIPVHGEARGLPCVEFEIRHDLILTDDNADRWAGLLERALRAVEGGYAAAPAESPAGS